MVVRPVGLLWVSLPDSMLNAMRLSKCSGLEEDVSVSGMRVGVWCGCGGVFSVGVGWCLVWVGGGVWYGWEVVFGVDGRWCLVWVCEDYDGTQKKNKYERVTALSRL